MTIAMETIAQYERRRRWEKRLRQGARLAVIAATHGVAFFLGGAIMWGFYSGEPKPAPTILIKKEVREVEVIRCDAAALRQCMKRRAG